MTGPTLKGCRCQCAACGEYFGSERAFDRHRVGDYAEPGQWQGTRRCLPLPDLLEFHGATLPAAPDEIVDALLHQVHG